MGDSDQQDKPADPKTVRVATEPGKSDPPRQGQGKRKVVLVAPEGMPGVTQVGPGEGGLRIGEPVEVTDDQYKELKARGFIPEKKAAPAKEDDGG